MRVRSSACVYFVPGLKRRNLVCHGSWQRSYHSVQALSRLIPNFQKTIDGGSPEELNAFYVEVSEAALCTGAFTH